MVRNKEQREAVGRSFLGLAVLLTTLATRVVAQSSPKEEKGPGELATQLTEGWKAKNIAHLQAFCRDWVERSHPVAEATLHRKPEFERAIYALFPAFFVPHALKSHSDYIVIQDKIVVRLVEGDLAADYCGANKADMEGMAWSRPYISQLTIHDFRPRLKIDGKKVLYLDERHLDAMLRFLTGRDESLVDAYWHEPNGYWESRQSGVNKGPEERRVYLEKYLPVAPGHWEVGWHFVSFPQIDLLLIDSKLETVIILYRGGFSGGGDALMQRVKGEWRVIHMEVSWQE
jgi:hypothetical protein